MTQPGRGWLGWVIRFTLGAVVGAIFGFRVVVAVNDPLLFFGVWGGATLLAGFLAAYLGIEFWEGLARLRWFLH